MFMADFIVPRTRTASDPQSPKLHRDRAARKYAPHLEELEERLPLAADVLYRIDAGGPTIAGSAVWTADTSANPSANSNANAAQSGVFSTTHAIDMSDLSIPAGVPEAVFQTERWDAAGGSEMQWNFNVQPGQFEVRLYFAEIWEGASQVGARVFDVAIEGAKVLDDYDIYADVGAFKAVMKSFVVVSDSVLNIEFGHGRENPALKGIEIVTLSQPDYLGVSPTSLSFGSVNIGQTATQTLTLTNLGDLGDPNIVLQHTAITGSNSAVFSDNFDDDNPVSLAPGQSVTMTVSYSPTSAANPQTANLTILHDGSNGPTVVALSGIAADPTATSTIVYRVNAGGAEVADDPSWTGDAGASPSPYTNATMAASNVFSTIAGIDMTDPSIPLGTPEALFKDERYDTLPGEPMQWNFAVTPGEYEVRLYFADIWGGTQGTGKRVFDVAIEGQIVLDHYDIYADVGGYKAVMKSFVVTTDNNINIDFADVTQSPAIKAIEIINRNVVQPDHFWAPSSFDLGAATINHSVTQQVSLVNQGQPGDPAISITGLSITGANASLFSVDVGAEPLIIQPGQYTTVNVTYSPTIAGTNTATLQIEYSGANSPYSVNLTAQATASAPISFRKSILSDTDSVNPTSLQFGPDGRLYVAQQDGLLKVYTIERLGSNQYVSTDTETIDAVYVIANHDDDGTFNPTVIGRLVTGILMAGTAEHPVIYVMSSDPRIGGADTGVVTELDTNSAILSRLTWTGSAWEKLDLVRGLPRSEENHSGSGMSIDPETNTLYIAYAGNTNMGAPSHNFAYLPEFALSAAIISVDLNMIGNSTYDLPTLDDENRPGLADGNDPFGGDNGNNQAILVPGGPVQVYAPGFRGPYDVVITAAGRMYSIDNGPNAGWGGIPFLGANGATNATSEPGVTYPDELQYISGPGYYGGHPNPTRANTDNTFNSTNPQSPVTVGNPVESHYIAAGNQDGALVTFAASTNGLVEYTASTFGGAMKGDLLAASLSNQIFRIKLNASGDQVELQQAIFNNVDVAPLDITAVGDDLPFAGTIWIVDWATGDIVVFEPNDDAAGSGAYDPALDDDNDGFNNADEIDNGTDPISAADAPPDWDADYVSNLNDPNDDNDLLPDNSDPFAIDDSNGTTLEIPITYTFDNDATNKSGLLNLGFTGLMTNGVDNYESLFDTSKMTSGGAAGVLTVDEVSAGDALGAENDQRYAFQFGVNAASQTSPFTAHTRILAPFAGLTPQGDQSMGLFVGNGDQDNYVKIVVTANGGAGGILTMKEEGGVVAPSTIDAVVFPGPQAVDLYLTIDPAALTVQASYAITTTSGVGPRILLGMPTSIAAEWLQGSTALAVGTISTTRGAPTFSATWDLIAVTSDAAAPVNHAPTVAAIADQSATEGGTLTFAVAASDPDGNPITFSTTSLPSFVTFTDNHNGTGSFTVTPESGNSGDYIITVTATDDGSPPLANSKSFVLAVAPAATSPIIYRINAGGPAIAGTTPWAADTAAAPSNYTNASASASQTFSTTHTIDLSNPSIPLGIPESLFQSERWDADSGAPMTWSFAVNPGAYEVRLYFADIWTGTQSVGARVFDVSIEGQLVLDNYDIYADVGAYRGVMKSFAVTSDAKLDILFDKVVENPTIKGIEILVLDSLFALGDPGNPSAAL